MNDITKHKWVDSDITGVSNCVSTTSDDKDILIHVKDDVILLGDTDAIAIAQHFYNQLSTFKRVGFINEIRGIEQNHKILSLDKIRGRH